MHSNRKGLDHGGFGKRQFLRQRMNNATRNHNVLCEGTVPLEIRRSYSYHLTVLTEVTLSQTAKRALAAIDGRVKRNWLAFFEVPNFRSRRRYYSGCLVAHDERRNTPAGRAIVSVNVAATDSTSFYLHEHIIRARPWHWHIHHFQAAVLGEQQSLHAAMVANRHFCSSNRGGVVARKVVSKGMKIRVNRSVRSRL
jgi:hypothetical protein